MSKTSKLEVTTHNSIIKAKSNILILLCNMENMENM